MQPLRGQSHQDAYPAKLLVYHGTVCYSSDFFFLRVLNFPVQNCTAFPIFFPFEGSTAQPRSKDVPPCVVQKDVFPRRSSERLHL